MAKKTKSTKMQPVITDDINQKMAALGKALEDIEKRFGKGSLMKLGASQSVEAIPVIPTGIVTLDWALGVGGLPRGRIIEIYGPESSGKTTVALQVIAQSQKTGGICAFVDAEHALDAAYAHRLGVNIDELYISQPDSGEQALEIVEALVRSAAMDVIVVDSVAALTPKAEIEGAMGDSFVGLHARLMSQALRKLTALISKTGCVCIFINQLREKVGPGAAYGNPEVTTGGRALKFYSTIRLDVRKADPVKSGTDLIGNVTRVKVVKNKVAPPFRVASFEMIFGQGASVIGTLLDVAVEHKIASKSGAYYSYGAIKLGQGREAAKRYLKQHPEVFAEMDEQVRKILFTDELVAPDAETDEETDAETEDDGIETDEVETEEVEAEEFDGEEYESEEDDMALLGEDYEEGSEEGE